MVADRGEVMLHGVVIYVAFTGLLGPFPTCTLFYDVFSLNLFNFS